MKINKYKYINVLQFFTYVRNKKYKQAYTLGQNILTKRPNNKAISGFCEYMLKNMLE